MSIDFTHMFASGLSVDVEAEFHRAVADLPGKPGHDACAEITSVTAFGYAVTLDRPEHDEIEAVALNLGMARENAELKRKHAKVSDWFDGLWEETEKRENAK